MTVFVDDMYKYRMGKYGRLKMSHMIADTDDELHDMARRIGVKRQWFQGDHYDICMSKRDLAIEFGAKEVTLKELGCMSLVKRKTGKLPPVKDAIAIAKKLILGRRH